MPFSLKDRSGPGASIATPITLPGTDQLRTYDLDGLGNWKNTNWTLVGPGGTTTQTKENRQHNYVNEITQVRDTTGGTSTVTPFAYDHGNNAASDDPLVQVRGNGNLVDDGFRTYQWDAFNRLVQVAKKAGGATLATYVYDATGRRIQKTIADLGGGNGGLTGDIPAGTTDYLYDGQQIVEERDDSTDAWTQAYYWGQYVDELVITATAAGGQYRLLSALLYRGAALVNVANNVIVEAYDTDAYGNTLCYSGAGTGGNWWADDAVRTNDPINPYIFTGREFDPETLIYYYRARYYAPQWGRWLSRDPLGGYGAKPEDQAEIRQGPNLYQYAFNNPIGYTDPSGQVIPVAVAVVIVGGMAIGHIAAMAAASYQLNPCEETYFRTPATIGASLFSGTGLSFAQFGANGPAIYMVHMWKDKSGISQSEWVIIPVQ